MKTLIKHLENTEILPAKRKEARKKYLKANDLAKPIEDSNIILHNEAKINKQA